MYSHAQIVSRSHGEKSTSFTVVEKYWGALPRFSPWLRDKYTCMGMGGQGTRLAKWFSGYNACRENGLKAVSGGKSAVVG